MAVNPAPHGLGPEEDERVASFMHGRFIHEDGMQPYEAMNGRQRKPYRRLVREVVDALQASGYVLTLEQPGARDFALIGRNLRHPTAQTTESA